VNNFAARAVLAGMRIHRRNGLPEPPAECADHTTDAPARRLGWRARRRPGRGKARLAPGSASESNQTVQAAAAETAAAKAAEAVSAEAVSAEAAPTEAVSPEAVSPETMGAAIQLAVALLTAGLDSPELEAWAADTLTPVDTDGLADLMAGLHVICVLLLHELHEATGEPSAAVMQRLAMVAERQRGTPFD